MAPLIVLTGPTASGKTGLAIELAGKFGGEIVCADSRTLYRGMDIGTAKPTLAEQARVPHHLLDIVDPGDIFTAADFQREACRCIDDIRARGKIPFLVGGTGLYIDAVTLEYEWPDVQPADMRRGQLETCSIDELQELIKEQQLELPVNTQNKRHLINVISRQGQQGRKRIKPRGNVFVVAIATDKNVLEERVRQRAYTMFQSGVVEETKLLADLYGWESEAMTSNIYPIIRQVIEGKIATDEAVELFVVKDRQLAKRQITWLRRHDFVVWRPLAEAGQYIETILRTMC